MIIKQCKDGKWETICISSIVRVVSKSGNTTYYLRDNLTFSNRVDLMKTMLEKETIYSCELSDTEKELEKINSKLVNEYKDKYENLLRELKDLFTMFKENSELTDGNIFDIWNDCATDLNEIIEKYEE